MIFREYFIVEKSTLTPQAEPYDLIEMEVYHSHDWSLRRLEMFGKTLYGSLISGSTHIPRSEISDDEAVKFYKEELHNVYQITEEEFEMFLNKTQEERKIKLNVSRCY